MTFGPGQLAATTRPRLLLVDDEEVVLTTLREVLSPAGYQLACHTDPRQALERLQQETFAVILSDQRMPAMTGLDFLAQARRLQSNATRILITAVPNLDTVIEAINKGEIYRFIVKPWIYEELLVTIRNGAQRHALLCANQELQARTQAANQQLQRQLERIEEQNRELGRLNRALEENLQRSADLCLQTLETYLPTLGNEARRVHLLCGNMAEVLRLPAAERQCLEMSAWLHDIGLIGVPRALIKRWQINPDGLTEAERALVEQHPALGQELARFVQSLESVGLLIRAHHERFDGEGFPDRLQGEQIPWLGRLLGVAVGYAQSNQPPADAAEAVQRAAGAAYDPEAVRIFLRALPRKQVEVLLSELQPGMLLARGIYNTTGLLLVPEGQCVTQTALEKVRNHDRINPIAQSLLVYC